MTNSFNAETSADEVLEGVDLTSKRILITGVSAGLGVETARALVSKGAHVVGAVRDLAKAKKATQVVIDGIKNGGKFELVELDLASLASVRSCADALIKRGETFDIVIANAGVMACPKGTTVDGFETQFGTNHIGHFVLINRILPLLKRGSRIVNLSSAGHRFSDVNLEDPNFNSTEYTEFGAYGRSKTANILFAVELDRRHAKDGIRATAVHPGGIKTELGRHMDPTIIEKLIEDINANRPAGTPEFKYKSVPQGAATTVWAAVVAPSDEIGGRYCEDCHVAKLSEGDALRDGVRSYAIDPQNAKALWVKSEELVGEKF